MNFNDFFLEVALYEQIGFKKHSSCNIIVTQKHRLMSFASQTSLQNHHHVMTTNFLKASEGFLVFFFNPFLG
jgi:hypothetical protein